jgi:hypothetical protein
MISLKVRKDLYLTALGVIVFAGVWSLVAQRLLPFEAEARQLWPKLLSNPDDSLFPDSASATQKAAFRSFLAEWKLGPAAASAKPHFFRSGDTPRELRTVEMFAAKVAASVQVGESPNTVRVACYFVLQGDSLKCYRVRLRYSARQEKEFIFY